MFKVEDIIDFNSLPNFIEKFKKCFDNNPIEIRKRILENERLSREKQVPWNKGLEGRTGSMEQGTQRIEQVPWNKGLKRVQISKL